MGKLINDNAYHVHMSAPGDRINSFENTIKERQSNNKIMDRGKKKSKKKSKNVIQKPQKSGYGNFLLRFRFRSLLL